MVVQCRPIDDRVIDAAIMEELEAANAPSDDEPLTE